jgi:phenylacetate-CoA ligase
MIMMRDSEISFKSKEEIKFFQEESLKQTINYVAKNSPFYQRLFRQAGVDSSSIRKIEDLSKLPTTSKKDVSEYNRDFLCVSKSLVMDYVTTSGTLGDPVTFMLTENDLDRLAYNDSLSFKGAGCKPGEVMQIMTTIDRRFMAGLAYFMGARKLGMGSIRVGNGIPELQWDSIIREKPDSCIVVPSFLIKLAEYAEEHGIDYSNTSLRRAICIGEPLKNSDLTTSTLTKKIIAKWPNLSLHSTYASTEMQSSFTECEHKCGCHHQPDLIIIELLDENEKPVGQGEMGELTITTLGVEGMPLVRFKTGDVCYMIEEKCKCGRNSVRLSPIVGRKGQMIKYKGTTLYPSALYDVLDNIPGIINYQVQVYTNTLGTDGILIKIGASSPSEAFEKDIKDFFRARIRVAPEITFEPVELIAKSVFPQTSRKAVKFVDLR